MNGIRISTSNCSWKSLWIIGFYWGMLGSCSFVFAEDVRAANSATANAAIPDSTVKSKASTNSKTGGTKKLKKAGKKSTGSTTPLEASNIKSESKPTEPLFATVNGQPILVSEFNAVYTETIKQRFYHGTVPDGQAEVVRKDVTTTLVDRELLVSEAKKRGVLPDLAKFDQVLANYDERYRDEPRWKEQRDIAIPIIKDRVARESLVEELQKSIKDVPKPTPTEVRAFYQQNPELFTEPEKPSLSVILLNVDPSSPQEEWSKVQEKAREIYDRVKGGGDFAEEARLYSSHASAENGGEMGYLHGGMLSEGLESKLSKLEVGEVSPPIKMLEGIAIYRLKDRIPAKLQEFSAVESRARELSERHRQTEAWTTTLKQLRATATIKYYSSPVIGEVDKPQPTMMK